MTARPTLLAQPELTDAVGYLQRKAARDLAQARAVLKRELANLIESATREHARLDGGMDLDMSGIRSLCDTRSIGEAFTAVREAEMMASTVAELVAPETEVGA